jgi:hypothetical protein
MFIYLLIYDKIWLPAGLSLDQSRCVPVVRKFDLSINITFLGQRKDHSNWPGMDDPGCQ